MGQIRHLSKAEIRATLDTDEIRERHDALAQTIGTDLAFFVCCAWLDIPYKPKISAATWESYISKLRENIDKCFSDGTTDIRDSLQKGMSQQERWEAEWGVGNEENRYTAKDYRRLDDIFRTLSARNEGMDAQQEFTLRNCSQMALLREKYIAKGGKESIDAAKSLDKMIQDNLAAENLRKKDMAGAEAIRIDGITDLTKRKLGFGVECTYQQALEACSKWLVSHHYNMTMDAAEKMFLAFTNATRINSDQPIFTELPVEADLSEFRHEFEGTVSSAAKREDGVYEYLGTKRGIQRAWQKPNGTDADGKAGGKAVAKADAAPETAQNAKAAEEEAQSVTEDGPQQTASEAAAEKARRAVERRNKLLGVKGVN